MDEKKNWRKKLFQNLHTKYRLVIMNDQTLEDKFSFKLSRFNVFVSIATSSVILIFLTTIIIAYTPLKEYIPGYASIDLKKEIYNIKLKSDSLENEFQQKDLFIYNMKLILEGKDIVEKLPTDAQIKKEISAENLNINEQELEPNRNDSLFRADFEAQLKFFGNYNISKKNSNSNDDENNISDAFSKSDALKNMFLKTPLKGIITNVFNSKIKHYGIDIVAEENSPIYSILDGSVFFAGWTTLTGFTIAIQHSNNIISVYKHNSKLLKTEGEFVEAGEPISIIGNTGKNTSGYHLHFELWRSGIPVDPLNYLSF